MPKTTLLALTAYCAYRIFWQYGPDEAKGKKRIPIITVVAITPHP